MPPLLLNLYPELKSLAQCDRFVAALADDHWLEFRKPWLEIPDLVSGEQVHWNKMITTVPEVAAFDRIIPGSESAPCWDYMVNVRRAAIRTIAVAAEVGTQTFLPTSSFGGDPTLRLSLKSGLKCRIGRVNDVAWTPAPSSVSRVVQLLQDPVALKAVEVGIFPLANLTDNAEEYGKHFSVWVMLAELRQIDITTRAPLIGPNEALSATPGGYTERYNLESIASSKVPIAVAAKIASPYAVSKINQVRLLDHTAPSITSGNLLERAFRKCTSGDRNTIFRALESRTT